MSVRVHVAHSSANQLEGARIELVIKDITALRLRTTTFHEKEDQVKLGFSFIIMHESKVMILDA